MISSFTSRDITWKKASAAQAVSSTIGPCGHTRRSPVVRGVRTGFSHSTCTGHAGRRNGRTLAGGRTSRVISFVEVRGRRLAACTVTAPGLGSCRLPTSALGSPASRPSSSSCLSFSPPPRRGCVSSPGGRRAYRCPPRPTWNWACRLPMLPVSF